MVGKCHGAGSSLIDFRVLQIFLCTSYCHDVLPHFMPPCFQHAQGTCPSMLMIASKIFYNIVVYTPRFSIFYIVIHTTVGEGTCIQYKLQLIKLLERECTNHCFNREQVLLANGTIGAQKELSAVSMSNPGTPSLTCDTILYQYHYFYCCLSRTLIFETASILTFNTHS